MNRSRRIVYALFVAGFFSLPGGAYADDKLDDLDVTMEVLDDASEFGELVNQMRGPDLSGIDDSLDVDDEVYVIEDDLDTEDNDPFAVDPATRADGFDRDNTLPESRLEHENDFEDAEGEDRDLDIVDDEGYY